MEYVDLCDLIKYLEYGTNLHVGVNFFGDTHSEKCRLPRERGYHSKPLCDKIKKDPEDYARCFKCRNYALKKAIKRKKAFGALCINGVYEYTRPIVRDGEVLAVIFIGNILTEDGKRKLSSRFSADELPLETMEEGFDVTACEKLGEIIESHILTLIEKYPSDELGKNPIIENVKTFLSDNLEYDLSVSGVAALFHYNEVYLGRLFKKECGVSIKEYVSRERISLAKKLLKTDLTVTETAKKCGFNSVSYFNKTFKEHTSLTQSEYKASRK